MISSRGFFLADMLGFCMQCADLGRGGSEEQRSSPSVHRFKE